MKPIDIKDQPVLSVRRTAEICLNGIKYRLFRSLVTMTVISVAIAFMMNIVSEVIGLKAVVQTAAGQTAASSLAARWTQRLTAAGTLESVLREIAGEDQNSSILAEVRRFSGLPESEFEVFRAEARAAASYCSWFDRLDYSRRRALIRDISGVAVFDFLQEVGALAQFTAALKKNRSVRLPTSPEEFQHFLHRWPALKARAQRLISAHEEAIESVARLSKGQVIAEQLSQADAAWGEQVRAAGFLAFDAAVRRQVTAQALQQKQLAVIEQSIQQPAARQVIAAYLDVLPGEINSLTFWRSLQSRSAAEWYHRRMAAAGAPLMELTPGRLVELANTRLAQAALENILRRTEEASAELGFMGIGARLSWLLLVALTLCSVGICNAMLMAVTERFREIATLKCLGALDGFIMLLFLMEAMALGLVGGLIGGLLGSVIGFGRLLASLGGIVWLAFPAGAWLASLGLAVVAGMVLSGIAGVYPSYLAARLAPMEAMRIE
ncbi:MAG: hypothetical protein HYV36_06695 [Lentisphaerae bacterium]|nr:hypothetical protein [Lentisphaerota bacterium]